MYVHSTSPNSTIVGEKVTLGMCMADTASSVQVREGSCRTLWQALTTPSSPAAQMLNQIQTPADIGNYCENYSTITAGNPTKKALVFMAILSAIAQQEDAWGHPAHDNGYGIFQLAHNIGRNYPVSSCQNISTRNNTENIRCGAYVALNNLLQGNRISSSNLGHLAMSDYFGSVQLGRSSQTRIAGNVRSYCRALAGVAL
jgi:hypothetical protein